MTEHSRHLVSFGRRRGRRLRSHQSGLMETLLPKLLITPSLIPTLIDEAGNKKLWFEIGFGAGEHLVGQAALHPEVNFIGCEPYVNGMASLLSIIDTNNLTNIRLYDGDARDVLEHLPDDSIERLFILFPDPWPKARHHKRRLISQPALALFYRKIALGGTMLLATDHEDYGAWMLEQLLAFKEFNWTAKTSADWKKPPDGWIRTRYQAKAEEQGQKAMFLEWVKA